MFGLRLRPSVHLCGLSQGSSPTPFGSPEKLLAYPGVGNSIRTSGLQAHPVLCGAPFSAKSSFRWWSMASLSEYTGVKTHQTDSADEP